jgi:hypothetical protein
MSKNSVTSEPNNWLQAFNPLDKDKKRHIYSGERCPTNAQRRCKQFLLCSLNYPDMYRLPNAIFREIRKV